MKNPIRRSDVVALVVGAAVGCVTIATQGIPSNPAINALVFLTPGVWVGLPVLGLFPIGLFSPAFILGVFLATAVFNALIYAAIAHLTRRAFREGWPLLIPVLLAVGLWTAWYVHWYMENRPKPEPPPAPVDLTLPLAGRWVGVGHGELGDFPVTLILHPHTDGTLDGFQRTGRDLVQRLEQGRYAGDSLYYETISFTQVGRRDSTTMRIESTVGGSTQFWELRFAGPDTGSAGVPDTVATP